MSNRLKLAFAEAAKLPEGKQDEFADFLLAELESEKRWQDAFARTSNALSTLAAEARKEYEQGLTKPLDDLLK